MKKRPNAPEAPSSRAGEVEALVEASTHIPGQLYDWGKSTETLRQLFDDLGTLQFDPLPGIGSPDGRGSGLVEKAA